MRQHLPFYCDKRGGLVRGKALTKPFCFSMVVAWRIERLLAEGSLWHESYHSTNSSAIHNIILF